jgi:hypothetical protein
MFAQMNDSVHRLPNKFTFYYWVDQNLNLHAKRSIHGPFQAKHLEKPHENCAYISEIRSNVVFARRIQVIYVAS